ncbi:MAG: hypothetical protein AAF236_11435 [Verrucomicrobiota bacterium]
MKTLVLAFFSGLALLFLASCASKDGPEPYRPTHSSMPHNIPQSWEGQAGLPGGFGGNQGGF